MSVLVTGAAGYLGSLLVAELAARGADVVALDVREVPPERRKPGVVYAARDIAAPGLGALLRAHGVAVVAHLASIVTPPKDGGRELGYRVDVLGTKNVLTACEEAGVGKIVVTSSGAAYGYHADNPAWLTEDHPLRGNEEFPYSHHKRLAEELLAERRRTTPGLKQVVFRVGTILGETVDNQITALFEKPFLISIRGSESPFVFIWDQDVVGALVEAVMTDKTGVYNVAGDGALPMRELAGLTGQRLLALPAWLLAGALAVLKPLGLTRYGPEQIRFLRYRPVLDNRKLKEEFGYVPKKTSREVFEFYLAARKKRA